MKKINVTKFLATTLAAATLLTGFEVPSVVKAEDVTNYTETTTTTTTVTEDMYDTLFEALTNSQKYYQELNQLIFESDKLETVKSKKSISKTFDNTYNSDTQVTIVSKKPFSGEYIKSSCGFKETTSLGEKLFDKVKLNGEYYYLFADDSIVNNSYKTKITVIPDSDTEIGFIISRDKVSGEKTKNVVSETPTSISGAAISAFEEYNGDYNKKSSYYNAKLKKFPKNAEAIEYCAVDLNGNTVFKNITYTKNMTVKVNPGIYKLLVRTRNTNAANEKIYSNWKKVKTFITQPKIDFKNSVFVKKGKAVRIKYAKVPGATKYEIWGAYSNQYYKKLVTTKKTSYDITKLNGKKINRKKDSIFYVVAVTKVDGKEIRSKIYNAVAFYKK